GVREGRRRKTNGQERSDEKPHDTPPKLFFAASLECFAEPAQHGLGSTMVDGKILALAGGVGGAKLALGLADTLAGDGLTIVVNTADDFEHLGLSISPDLDTVMYTLARVANPETGWGRRDESWNALAALGEIGGDTWFRLGDRDLATHIERTRR